MRATLPAMPATLLAMRVRLSAMRATLPAMLSNPARHASNPGGHAAKRGDDLAHLQNEVVQVGADPRKPRDKAGKRPGNATTARHGASADAARGEAGRRALGAFCSTEPRSTRASSSTRGSSEVVCIRRRREG